MIIHPFQPVYNEESEILILGSFPSVKSRENNFYYGNPLNRFWDVLSAVLKCEKPNSIEEKTEMLIINKIALWDSLESCDIIGSADNTVKNPVANDIVSLVNKTKIKKILFNGKTAFSIYQKYAKNKPNTEVHILPSTSPANARFPLNELINEWKTAFYI